VIPPEKKGGRTPVRKGGGVSRLAQWRRGEKKIRFRSPKGTVASIFADPKDLDVKNWPGGKKEGGKNSQSLVTGIRQPVRERSDTGETTVRSNGRPILRKRKGRSESPQSCTRRKETIPQTPVPLRQGAKRGGACCYHCGKKTRVQAQSPIR